MAHHVKLIPAAGGTRLSTVDSTAVEKVAADDTDGAYELFEIQATAGRGIAPHRHAWPEAYHVLEGHLEVRVGRRTFDLDPGDTLTVPPDALHTFEVTSPRGRFLAFSLGDRMGQLFADLDLEVPDAPIPEVLPQLLAIAGRHGVEFPAP